MAAFAITRERDISVIDIRNPPDIFGIAYLTFSSLAEAGVDVDLILQTSPGGRGYGIMFTVRGEDSSVALETMKTLYEKYDKTEIILNRSAEKISISGLGMRGGVGVAARILKTLYREDIFILGISTSEIKISLAVDEKYADAAMNALLREFEMQPDN